MRTYTWHEIIFKIILPAVWETVQMVIPAMLLACLLGFILAVLMFITRPNGLHPNKRVYFVFNIVISVVRAFPFVILIVSIQPLTRAIVGTIIGTKAAIVPLTLAATPFMARMFENSLKEVDLSLIEAAKSLGATDLQLIRDVVLVEAVPSLISNMILCIIQILGLSTIAGTVGGGGLGTTAITYGYQSFNLTIMYTVCILLCVIVLLIQSAGDYIYKKYK